MRILLSAYACEPHTGSDPGIGWNWAMTLNELGHDVWVITRANNQPAIEAGLAGAKQPEKLRFVYIDLDGILRKWKKKKGAIYLYYFLWQIKAANTAKALHRKVMFDLVHHVTLSGFRQPSFMGGLGVPFIFGPVGGGEAAPRRLRKGLGTRGQVMDLVRDLSNAFVRIDPFMQYTFNTAEKIWVTSPQTRKAIPQKYKNKVATTLSIGMDGTVSRHRPCSGTTRLQLVFAGRLIYWKGMHIGLSAISKLIKMNIDVRLTIAGDGPEQNEWQRLARSHGLDAHVNWVGKLSQKALFDLYDRADLMLFPSLHDSGGMVVLEAFARGLPVVCLDLGGPGIMVDKNCGRKIRTSGRSTEQVADALARAVAELAVNREELNRLQTGALKRAEKFTWQALVNRIYAFQSKSKDGYER